MSTVLAAVGMVLLVSCAVLVLVIAVAAWARFGDAPEDLRPATLRPRG
jgi:hypothetical protein